MSNKYYVVQYNDKYNNGKNKVLETLVRDEQGFQDWLKAHNAERDMDGEIEESADEFELIAISLFES
jgi:hypothetical protein